ncbi:EamA family transporter [Amycolatopsis suaedae]|uniref:Multidrug DMT transporter permease n=1 Tax=Amycolatopsis suaedae TaxID=2510978 RepID=A0A4Q7J9W6_9PSEU|nr:EamA family transporter [Amycolatopsis suaedae]RZQ63808.1 multidrug DMT transporter permease [Amycolatopsis suaedae]
MGTLLALASSVSYGVADVAGGLLSRKANPVSVALLGQLSGLVLTLVAALVLPAADPAAADLGWGALSGVGTGVAMVFLYRGLGRGAMSVVVPVSAVGGLALPVVVGVLLLGDRPSVLAWTGIAVAVPALWLVSRTGRDGGAGSAASIVDAVVASAGVALQYLALAQAAPAAGIWPVVVGRLAAAVAILPMVRASLRIPGRLVAPAAATGAFAALALVCYLLATRQQLVVVAVVLSSLYPAIPVLWGIARLRERLSRPQVLGLLGAGAAVALLALGK